MKRISAELEITDASFKWLLKSRTIGRGDDWDIVKIRVKHGSKVRNISLKMGDDMIRKLFDARRMEARR